MRKLTEQEKDRLWEEVLAESPNDRVMQEVHFARRLHGEMLQDEPPESRSAFFREEARMAMGRSGSGAQSTPA